jgi:hypothetical protein
MDRIIALRVAILLVSIGLLSWLVWSPQNGVSRIAGINRGLVTGTIGHLDSTSEAELKKTLDWLSAAAGFDETISLDQPYSVDARKRGELQVFVTTPEARRYTQCGTGNAVYDASLDAVFIDKEIVIPADWQQLLAAPDDEWGLSIPLTLHDAPWLRVYLRFVILHELGHRKLHRKRATAFDVHLTRTSAELKEMENDADEFAISQMMVAYSIAGRFGVQPVEEYTGDTIHYPVKASMPVADQVQASLVEMALLISAGRLALPSVTPLYRDDYSHPSYIDRAQGLVRQSLMRNDINPDLKLYAQYVDESMDRMQQSRKSGMVEITADQPIGGALFDEQGLVVVLHRTLYRVPFAELEELLREDRPISLEDATRAKYANPLKGFQDHGERLVGYWSSSGVGTILLWQDGKRSIISSDFRATVNRQATPQRDITYERVITPPQPSIDVAGIGKDKAGNIWIVAFQKDQIVSSITEVGLKQSCERLGAPLNSSLDLELARVNGGEFFVPVLIPGKGGSQIAGFLQARLEDLKDPAFFPLRIPAQLSQRTSSRYNPLLASEAGDREIAFERINSQTRAILVNIERLPATDRLVSGRGVKWQTWELFPDHDPRLLHEQTLLADYFNRHLTPGQVDELAMTPRLAPGGVQLLPPDQVLINVDQDSIYLCGGSALRVVFHPGSDNVVVRAGSNGMVAVYFRPGYRIFILRNTIEAKDVVQR